MWSSLLESSVFTDRGGDSFLPPTPLDSVPEMSVLDEEACLLAAAKAPVTHIRSLGLYLDPPERGRLWQEPQISRHNNLHPSSPAAEWRVQLGRWSQTGAHLIEIWEAGDQLISLTLVWSCLMSVTIFPSVL